jgi:hypothetical protein
VRGPSRDGASAELARKWFADCAHAHGLDATDPRGAAALDDPAVVPV